MTNPADTATTASAAPTAPRYQTIDIARGIGILLVIYGHFLQSFFQPDAPLVFMQYQFVYAFHMPLFFILSGLVGQIAPTNFRKNLRGGIELVALVFIVHIVGIGIDLLTRDQTLAWSTPEIFIDGLKTGNVSVGVMWFLLCLGIIRLTVGSALLIRNVPARIAAVIAILAAFAWQFSQRHGWPVWQDTTLFFGAFFFLVGRLAPLRLLPKLADPRWLLATIPATLWLAFHNHGCAFDWVATDNSCGGPVYDGAHPIIMMMGEYNNYPLFVLGALAGTLMTLQISSLFARTITPNATLTSIGKQTLGLLLVNAFYCAFLLPLVQAHMPTDGIDSLTLTIAAIGLTLIQIFAYQVLKPATDSLTAIANWIARGIARA